jgi:hypothetical protein
MIHGYQAMLSTLLANWKERNIKEFRAKACSRDSEFGSSGSRKVEVAEIKSA